MNAFKRSWVIYFVILIAAIALLMGCTNAENVHDSHEGEQNDDEAESAPESGSDPENEPETEPDPVSLLINFPWGEPGHTDYFKDPIEEKFPHITVEWVDASSGDLEDAIAAGRTPDVLFHISLTGIGSLQKQGLAYDLTPHMEETNFDVNRIEEGVFQTSVRHSVNGEINVLPLERTVYGLFYNRDIFDNFGVSYPDDAMTWNEVINLASEVTREEGGVQYYGLRAPDATRFNQFSTSWLDENEDVYVADNPHFRTFFELLERQVDIPGNIPSPEVYNDFSTADFVGDQTVAMYATWSIMDSLQNAEESGLQWDVASYPHNDGEQVQPVSASHGIGISPSTDHPDEAWRVVEFLLSDEYQKYFVDLTHKASPLENPEINELLFSQEGMEDKNIESMFEYPSQVGPPHLSEYESDVNNLEHGIHLVLEGETDIGSVLQELQELAETDLEEARAMN